MPTVKVKAQVDVAELLYEALKPPVKKAWTALVLRPPQACLRKSTNPKVRLYFKNEKELHLLVMQRGYNRQVEVSSFHELDWVLSIILATIPLHVRIM